MAVFVVERCMRSTSACSRERDVCASEQGQRVTTTHTHTPTLTNVHTVVSVCKPTPSLHTNNQPTSPCLVLTGCQWWPRHLTQGLCSLHTQGSIWVGSQQRQPHLTLAWWPMPWEHDLCCSPLSLVFVFLSHHSCLWPPCVASRPSPDPSSKGQQPADLQCCDEGSSG